MAKTLIALFSVPLIAQSGIDFDVPTIPPSVLERYAGPTVEKQHIAAAVEGLTISAQMNDIAGRVAANTAPPHEHGLEEGQQREKLAELIGKINTMLEQTE